jgi:hypothetical protein
MFHFAARGLLALALTSAGKYQGQSSQLILRLVESFVMPIFSPSGLFSY